MESIVPLISSGTAGPLGLAHLPRLWLKILLHATGRLPEGYRYGAGGIDELTMAQVGIDVEDFVAYVESELPNYLQAEAWVRAHATKLDAVAIAAYSEGLHKRNKPEAQLPPQRAFIGITDPNVRGTVVVNDLDDWTCVHALLTKGAIPPLIASSLHSAFSELLQDVVDELEPARALVRINLPKFGFDPLKPLTEAKQRGVASILDQECANIGSSGAIEYIKRERKPLIQDDIAAAEPGMRAPEDQMQRYEIRSRMVGPIFLDAALVAWISVHDRTARHWTAEDQEVLAQALRRSTAFIEEVAKKPA